MRLVVTGIVLVVAAYFLIQTPAGQAMVVQIAGMGRALTNNIVGNLSH
jgi:hypothetical protein